MTVLFVTGSLADEDGEAAVLAEIAEAVFLSVQSAELSSQLPARFRRLSIAQAGV